MIMPRLLKTTYRGLQEIAQPTEFAYQIHDFLST